MSRYRYCPVTTWNSAKGLTVLLLVTVLLPTVHGAVIFDSSESIRFNVSSTEQARINGTGLDLFNNDVYNYFGSNCGDNEVVSRIKPDGSYVCTSLDDAGTDNQTLAEVLVQGNVANRSIDMDGNDIVNCGFINGNNCSELVTSSGQSESNRVATQAEWNNGTFNGTSADRKDNSGPLGIGYLNGSEGGQPNSDGLNNESLVGYWRLDAASDPLPGEYDVRDYSGYGNNGSNNGASRGAMGVFGTNGFGFDGEENYVSISDAPELSGGPSATITGMAWFKVTDNTTENFIVQKQWGTSDGDWGLDTERDGGIMKLRYYSEYSGTDYELLGENRYIKNNTWHHAAFVLDQPNNDLTLYLDGVQVAQDTSTGTISTDTDSNVYIGAQFYQNSNDQGEQMNGTIDEVRVYNRTLSQSEIKQLVFNQSDDKHFQGNYTSETIDTSDTGTRWETIYVNATVPSQTDVNLVFHVVDAGGSIVDTEVVSVMDGAVNYTLDVQDAEDAYWTINGTSTNVTKTWEIHEVTTYYNTGDDTETLEETLKAGNSAGSYDIDMNENDIINTGQLQYEGGIEIGNAGTTTSDSSAVAIGDDAQATALNSLALGPDASASAAGAVAIGNQATAPNTDEATFGNLGSDRLNVNITGNATIHGGRLDLKSDDNVEAEVELGDGMKVKKQGNTLILSDS